MDTYLIVRYRFYTFSLVHFISIASTVELNGRIHDTNNGIETERVKKSFNAVAQKAISVLVSLLN